MSEKKPDNCRRSRKGDNISLPFVGETKGGERMIIDEKLAEKKKSLDDLKHKLNIQGTHIIALRAEAQNTTNEIVKTQGAIDILEEIRKANAHA